MPTSVTSVIHECLGLLDVGIPGCQLSSTKCFIYLHKTLLWITFLWAKSGQDSRPVSPEEAAGLHDQVHSIWWNFMVSPLHKNSPEAGIWKFTLSTSGLGWRTCLPLCPSPSHNRPQTHSHWAISIKTSQNYNRSTTLSPSIRWHDLFRGSCLLTGNLDLHDRFVTSFKELLIDLRGAACTGFIDVDAIGNFLTGFLLCDKDDSCSEDFKDFCFKFLSGSDQLNLIDVLSSVPCILGRRMDSSGTSFPSIWFVNTKLTCIHKQLPCCKIYSVTFLNSSTSKDIPWKAGYTYVWKLLLDF